MVRHFQKNALIDSEELGLIDGETVSDALIDGETLWLIDGDTLSDAEKLGLIRW